MLRRSRPADSMALTRPSNASRRIAAKPTGTVWIAWPTIKTAMSLCVHGILQVPESTAADLKFRPLVCGGATMSLTTVRDLLEAVPSPENDRPR